MFSFWEKFSFYGLLVILSTLVHSPSNNIEWINQYHLDYYLIAFISRGIAEVFGGFISDLFIGQKRSILVGTFIVLIGYYLLASDYDTFLIHGIAIIIIGIGILRPNIIVMIGNLYLEKDYLRIQGFGILHIVSILAIILPNFFIRLSKILVLIIVLC